MFTASSIISEKSENYFSLLESFKFNFEKRNFSSENQATGKLKYFVFVLAINIENFQGVCCYNWYSYNDVKEIGRINTDSNNFITGVLSMIFVIIYDILQNTCQDLHL